MFLSLQINKNDLNVFLLIKKILKRITPYIPLGYDNKPIVKIKDGFLFFSFLRSSDSKEKIIYGEKSIVFYDGYFLEKYSADIDENSVRSLGGVNSYLLINGDEIFADTTSAGLFSIYFSNENRIVISSRPLLVELVRTLFNGDIQINSDSQDLISRLAFGSWIDGSTGFKYVRRLKPDNRLKISISTGELSLERKNIFSNDDFSCVDINQSIEKLTESLIASVSSKGKKTLLMSGGKDSRTIAAVLDGSGRNFSGIVNGDPENEEVIVARDVFENCCNAEHFESRYQRAYYDSVYAAMESSIRTEGQVSHVAHQIYFDNLNFYPGLTYHGHGHLLRGGTGGWPTDSSTDVHQKKLLGAFISGWVNNNLTGNCQEFLNSFYRDIGFSEKIAFYAHLNFRVGAYQSPGILEMSGGSEYRFPLCDEMVVSSARKIALSDLQQERAIFGVIKKLSPKLSSIPLYGEMWAFEKNSEDAFFPGRSMRISKIDKNHFRSKRSGLELLGATRDVSRESVAAQFIIDSGYLSIVRDLLTPRMVAVIESYATKDALPEEEIARPMPVQGSAKRKMFEIFGLAINQKTNWLRPVRPVSEEYISFKYI